MSEQNIRCDKDSEFEPIEETLSRDLSEFYKMFADPGRIRILFLLNGREVCVNHIAEKLGMTISAVSHQLRLLRIFGLVRSVREGKKNYYTLDDSHVSTMLDIAKQHLAHKI